MRQPSLPVTASISKLSSLLPGTTAGPVSPPFFRAADVSSLIGAAIIGVGPYRIGLLFGLIVALINYVLTLVGVYVIAFAIDALAPSFGGRKDFTRAFKVAAYAPTAVWVAGVFSLLPVLSALTILGLYSLYLIYLGLPVLMRTPPERAIGYVLAVIVCAIIVWILIFSLPLALLGTRLWM